MSRGAHRTVAWLRVPAFAAFSAVGSSLALAALILPSPSFAQGTRIAGPLPMEPVAVAEARKVMRDFAHCVVPGNRARVAAFLAMAPFSRGADAAGRALATDACLEEGQLQFNLRLFRGALFEQLYRLDHPQLAAARFDGVARLTYPVGPDDTGGAWQRNDLALLDFGECVVRAAPGEIHALLQTPVASAREQAALAVLGPRFSACLNSGVTVQFSMELVRGILAEALYRLSAAAPAVHAP